MASIIFAEKDVRLPAGFANLDAYRRWAKSADFPERGRFAYLAGDLFVDFSMEQAFTHNRVKGKYSTTIDRLVEERDLGYFFFDRMLLSNVTARLSTEPDGMFVAYRTLERGLVRLMAGTEGGYVELEGSPHMVLEVVSASSVEKDTVILPELYAAAGIGEYWLVDARGDEPQFVLYRLGSRGYAAVRRQAGGWQKSAAFGRSFRFAQQIDRLGHPQYTLEIRDK